MSLHKLFQKRVEKKEPSTTSKKLKTIEESSPVIKKNPALLKASSLQPQMDNVLAELQHKKISKQPSISEFPDDEASVSVEKTLSVGRKTIDEQQLEKKGEARERHAMAQKSRVAEEEQSVELERHSIMGQQARAAEEQRRLEKERLERAAAAKRQAEDHLVKKTQLEHDRYVLEENAIEMEFQSSDASKSQSSPKETRPQSRREILNQRRNRRFSSSPAVAAPSAALPIAPSVIEKSKSETTTQKPTDPQQSTTARATARDRYARHKKMIAQQRHTDSSTTTNNNNDAKRTFSC